jgi:hypothetical protein
VLCRPPPNTKGGITCAFQPHCLLQLGIEVDAQRPGEEVLLTFLAPKEMLARFLADLKAQGLEVCKEPLIPGVVVICRLGARSLQ